MDTLGIEPRASRMLSGCDTTTPCARACCTPAVPNPATAQLVEHLAVEPCNNQMVPGSIPGGRISRANAQRTQHGGTKPATHLHNIPPPGLEPGSLGRGPSILTSQTIAD